MMCYLEWISSLKRSINQKYKFFLFSCTTSMASVKRNFFFFFWDCRVSVDPYLISSITVERESIWLPPRQYLSSLFLPGWTAFFLSAGMCITSWWIESTWWFFIFFSKRRRRKTWIFPAESFEWRQVGWPWMGQRKRDSFFCFVCVTLDPSITLFLRSLFSIFW